MTPKQQEQFAEIRRLLIEAYDDYFKRSDGWCKSAEGSITVGYPNYFEREDYAPGEACYIGVYSYALGPHRLHDFDSFDEALETVRGWHKLQLESEDYSDDA